MSSSVLETLSGGDWICGDVTCHHLNFARRTQCNKCQRPRSPEVKHSKSGSSIKKKLGTEIGKAAAEKSRGLFSAEDWQCSKCANVNWARRQTCNLCNAPRFCDVEERTGYGGGYNDRGIVEYKEREESDSEYDEFGRLKKRRKKSSNGSSASSSIEVKGEDDEDDEENDGSDLAKYDLFGDEEVFNNDARLKNHEKLDSNKHEMNEGHKDFETSRISKSYSCSVKSNSTSTSPRSSVKSNSSSSQYKSRSRSRSRSMSRSHSIRNRSCSRSRSYSRRFKRDSAGPSQYQSTNSSKSLHRSHSTRSRSPSSSKFNHEKHKYARTHLSKHSSFLSRNNTRSHRSRSVSPHARH